MRDVFDAFAEVMYRKYLARVDKPGNTTEPWKDFSEELLIARLREEIEELMVEIDRFLADGDNIEELSDELIDVADFCMYLWLKLNAGTTTLINSADVKRHRRGLPSGQRRGTQDPLP